MDRTWGSPGRKGMEDSRMPKQAGLSLRNSSLGPVMPARQEEFGFYDGGGKLQTERQKQDSCWSTHCLPCQICIFVNFKRMSRIFDSFLNIDVYG